MPLLPQYLWILKTAVQQGRSERSGEEVRPALVEPFAHTMDLGEREITSSASDICGIPSQR